MKYQRETVLQLWLSKGRRVVCVDQVFGEMVIQAKMEIIYRERDPHSALSVRLWIVQSVLPCYPRLDKYWVSQLTPVSGCLPPHPPIFPPLSTVGLWCPRWVVAEYFFKSVTSQSVWVNSDPLSLNGLEKTDNASDLLFSKLSHASLKLCMLVK